MAEGRHFKAPVTFTIDFKACLLVHKALNGSAPSYITDSQVPKNSITSITTEPPSPPPYPGEKTGQFPITTQKGEVGANTQQENYR